jgi:hypothetical protein
MSSTCRHRSHNGLVLPSLYSANGENDQSSVRMMSRRPRQAKDKRISVSLAIPIRLTSIHHSLDSDLIISMAESVHKEQFQYQSLAG